MVHSSENSLVLTDGVNRTNSKWNQLNYSQLRNRKWTVIIYSLNSFRVRFLELKDRKSTSPFMQYANRPVQSIAELSTKKSSTVLYIHHLYKINYLFAHLLQTVKWFVLWLVRNCWIYIGRFELSLLIEIVKRQSGAERSTCLRYWVLSEFSVGPILWSTDKSRIQIVLTFLKSTLIVVSLCEQSRRELSLQIRHCINFPLLNGEMCKIVFNLYFANT